MNPSTAVSCSCGGCSSATSSPAPRRALPWSPHPSTLQDARPRPLSLSVVALIVGACLALVALGLPPHALAQQVAAAAERPAPWNDPESPTQDMKAEDSDANSAPTPPELSWPADLEELHFFLPDRPNGTEAEAVLRITALATQRAAGRDVTVGITPLQQGTPVAAPRHRPNARAVVLRRGESAKVQLIPALEHGGPPLVQLAGPPGELPALVDALFPEEANRQVPEMDALQTGRQTLAKLAKLTLGATIDLSSERPEFRLPFSQADLDGSMERVALHLKGSYVPRERGASTTLAVLLNGGLVQAVPLEQWGPFEVRVDFPAALLHRNNTLSLRAMGSPPDTSRARSAFRILVDKSSYLEGEKGQSLPPGFERFPQALLPEFRVTFDDLRPEALEGAAQLVALLQRLAPRPLHPTVATWDEAIADPNPLLAVVVNPARADALRPPLQTMAFGILGRDGQELLRLSPEACFAMLQAYHHRNRDVLLLTHRDYREGLGLLPRQLLHQDGWYGLEGNVWLQPSDGLPFALSLQDKAVRLRPLDYNPFSWWSRIRPLFYGTVTVLVILLLLWMYPRVVRSQAGLQT